MREGEKCVRRAGYALYDVSTVMLDGTLWCAYHVDVSTIVGFVVVRKADLFDRAVLEAEKYCTILTRKKCYTSDIGLGSTATKSEGI